MLRIMSGWVSVSRSLLPFKSTRPVGKTLATILGLTELMPLDHGAHGPIQDQDAFGQQGPQLAIFIIRFHHDGSADY